MSSFYDPSSFAMLSAMVAVPGGNIVAAFPLAFITNRPRAGLRFVRQHIALTGSATLNAFDASSCNGLHRKVYKRALAPTADGRIGFETLDRRRSGHYVWTWDVSSYPWLTGPALVGSPSRSWAALH